MAANGQLVFMDVDKVTFKGVGGASNAVIDTTTGKIGVGVDSPDANLHVLGNCFVSTNFELGGTMTMGTVTVRAQHELSAITATGNTTPHTVEFTNAETSLVTTGNVSVGKELTVAGNVSDLNVVSNVNMLHTANTASIKLNSNVVTEFPRSKKLIKYPRVALGTGGSPNSGTGGGYTLSGYTVKASDEYNATDYTASKAFTNTNIGSGDTWISTGSAYTSADGLPVANSATVAKFGQNGSWIEVGLPNAIQLHSTRVFGRHTHFTERSDTADIWASNTGNDGDWVKLTTISFNDTYTDVIPMVADIDTQAYYQYFAIQITKIGWNGTYANIGEWELFGIPEYDPEAHGTDVVVKSVPNVPNTDWLEVYYDAKDLVDGAVTSVEDLSPNSNGGLPSDSPQVSNGAFVFDGVNDYIYNSQTGYTGGNTYTGSAWIKKTANINGCVFQFGNGSNGNSFGIFYYGGSIDYIRAYVFGYAIANSNSGSIPWNEWIHVTGVYSDKTATLYINGIEVATNTGSTGITIPSTPYLTLGAQTDNTNTPYAGTYFTGSIANFRLFNRALTSDEIYQLYAYQKEYFGHGVLGMTLKAGRLGIGTSEPRVALDVRGDVNVEGRVLSGHASGGTESVVDGYKIHTFTTSSNFNVVTPGVVEYLIIGGGGGGGGTHGGGGGGGGFIQGHALVKSGSHSIVVGGGGTGSTAQGANGVNSTAFGLTAVGGGGGGRGYDANTSSAGNIGGSSGGSGPFVLTGSDSRDFGKVPEKTYTNRYQGNGGGGGNNTGGAGHAGGGGGAGGPGGNATTTSDYYAGNGISGAGGSGLVSYITGSPVIYAGGGSGGRWSGSQSINVQGGVGGTNGGGGIGGAIGASGMAATAGGINTGGGGGGGSDNGGRGGNGGSGIVVLRYPV